jgi:hypothetical protein
MPTEGSGDPAAAAGRPGTGFHGVRTQWIRGLMAFQLVRHAQVIRLAVSDIVIFMGQCGG